jgi:hypothetical protein
MCARGPWRLPWPWWALVRHTQTISTWHVARVARKRAGSGSVTKLPGLIICAAQRTVPRPMNWVHGTVYIRLWFVMVPDFPYPHLLRLLLYVLSHSDVLVSVGSPWRIQHVTTSCQFQYPWIHSHLRSSTTTIELQFNWQYPPMKIKGLYRFWNRQLDFHRQIFSFLW